MGRKKEILLLLISDFIFANLAWAVYYFIRIESGWITYIAITTFLIPSLIIYIYWLLIFTIAGLYQHWFVRSRFDEFSAIVKVVSAGCFILFFVIFLDDAINNAQAISRYLILIYWGLLIVFVGVGRIIIRTIQIGLLDKGIGLRNSIIVGTGDKANNLYSLILKYPQLGYNILGFIATGINSDNYLGSIKELKNIINEKNVSEVLIALESNERNKLFEIIEFCSPYNVNMKIMPDAYDIVSGMVKTNQIYGVPLIEVMPQIMPYSSKVIKRGIDIALSLLILLFLFPLLIVICFLIKLTSRGPVFYTQIRVGKGGRKFIMYKFRTMFENAEEYGPEWAGENDTRITKIGKLVRKLYMDELPQLINVLKNDMSIVGPRPERPHFVDELKKEIPYYYKYLSRFILSLIRE